MRVHSARDRFMMARVKFAACAPMILCVAVTAGCGGTGEPRFAEVTVSSVAPNATLSGTTRGVRSATELSPGCPGYLDPDAPEHIVRVSDDTAIRVRARSSEGPVALAVVGDGEVRCDSDGGSGHAPEITLNAPGRYAVHVASLGEGEELPYELAIANVSDGDAPRSGEPVRVSITITSEPSGATVRTAEGRVLGTTPAMFTVAVPQDELGQERRYLLDMPGRAVAEVSGSLTGGAVVLHATMPAPSDSALTAQTSEARPGELVVRSNAAARIRDHQVARQSVDIESDCTIERATVDIDIVHSYIADLRVVLRSPAGTSITLHDHGGGGRANLITSYDSSARRALQRLVGQNGRGRWEMSVHDDAGADTGTFRGFALRLSCRVPSVSSENTEVSTVTEEPTPQRPRAPARIRATRPPPPPPPPIPRAGPVIDPFAPTQPPQPWLSPSTGRSNQRPARTTP